ncbi:DsbA family protein [Agromyces seonyuensis]|uniref:DsbA family oxidoreductase n=1 Tax=Agromyces seonyuensis TaxID=2662446 RepID=A0A6I4P023_9MICO|nr:DsbA family oxidoreductase [Agromyces seonyuensis]
MSNPINIDIWSDIACPWCFIGKRHLEAGIAALGEDAPDVNITYHSYELSPDTPADFVGSTTEYLAGKRGMPVGQVEQMLERVTGIAAEAGLHYDFDQVKHTKTLKAHELLHFAKAHGKQLELNERLLSAYFEEGGYVNRVDDLVAYAAEVGLDADAARSALESGEYHDAVQADIAQAGAYGIQGVPFFVFEGKYGVSGAQPAEVFSNVLTQLAEEQAA